MSETAVAPAASVIEHAFRRSVLEKEKRFTLSADALTVQEEGRPEERFPLSDVRDVHLRFHRTQQRDYYQCRIGLAGGRTIFLQHVHWGGIASFEDRRATYTPFVLALHALLRPHAARVSFRAGSFGTFLMALIVTPIIAVLFLGTLIVGRWIAAGLLALVLLTLLPIIPRSRPRGYAPDAPPARLLP
ncbi:MAG TPA: hypothetical protein VHG91_19735 [Longimicrobium sp.]|nr:hypothetical protein [Longimicrobium sp.]